MAKVEGSDVANTGKSGAVPEAPPDTCLECAPTSSPTLQRFPRRVTFVVDSAVRRAHSKPVVDGSALGAVSREPIPSNRSR